MSSHMGKMYDVLLYMMSSSTKVEEIRYKFVMKDVHILIIEYEKFGSHGTAWNIELLDLLFHSPFALP